MFPSEVNASIGTELWLHPQGMRIVMSTKTRNISFDGQAHFLEISHEKEISEASHCVIHIQWMLIKECTD